MISFLKENKLISTVFVVSIFTIIAYVLSLDVPEWFSHAGDWFNIMFQLAIGFVINFMFYVTQVYIPRLKQLKQANACVIKRVERIEGYMSDLINYIAYKYIANYDEKELLTREQFALLMQKLNFDDEINVINANRAGMCNCHFTVQEWIRSCISSVEHDIDKLYMYYAAYISPELMSVLEEILKSTMHQNMGKILVQIPQEISFEGCKEDIYFEPYYNIINELKNAKEQYK